MNFNDQQIDEPLLESMGNFVSVKCSGTGNPLPTVTLSFTGASGSGDLPDA